MSSTHGDDLRVVFAEVWQTADRPYPFQERVTRLLAQGKRVVLQAPTGAGKTRAALTAFLHNRAHGSSPAMPQKCFYAVPMRVLATQFYSDQSPYAELAGARPTIQTGEQQGDRRLAGDLVFLTIDQLLSSFLTMPYSLPYRLANLNAGALVGAYIVLDEFHLFEPDTTLAAALDMLVRLRGLGPALVMTATFSSRMLGELASILGAEIVTTPPDEVDEIETRWRTCSPRQRTWRTADSPLTAEAVLAAHEQGCRSLVVCNQVERAQKLYDKLSSAHPRVILLHSRFLPHDRRRWEDELRASFARDSQADIIAVATQVVEVGLDISADVVHTELAPAAALIQRAGRCARYPGQRGTVWVYPTESPRPYAMSASKPVAVEMEQALAWLGRQSGQVMGFVEEQALIDAVCAERDALTLEGLRAGTPIFRSKVERALGGDAAARQGTELVRDANSRQLLIHDSPDVLLSAPYDADGFAVHPAVLAAAFHDWQAAGAGLGLPWVVKRLTDGVDEEEADQARYHWESVGESRELLGSGVVVVHPALAGYDNRRGLLLREATGYRSKLPDEGRTQEAAQRSSFYHLETYLLHVQRLLAALASEAWPELAGGAEALERRAGWPVGSMRRAAWLVCALHDVGKLSRAWQGWAHRYQRAVGQPVTEPVAHTCFDAANPRHNQAQKTAGARPSHAAQGALAVTRLLAGALGGEEALTRAALSAIARHHGPFTEECPSYSLDACAIEQIDASLRQLPPEARAGADACRVSTANQRGTLRLPLLARPAHEREWLAYTILVRALRLADQAATAAGAQEPERS